MRGCLRKDIGERLPHASCGALVRTLLVAVLTGSRARERNRCRRTTFQVAGCRASVPRHDVAVIATFPDVNHTVATARERTVGTADRAHGRIALFMLVDLSVTACRREITARPGIARQKNHGVTEARFTPLSERTLQNAVTAGTGFKETRRRAAVTRAYIAVITFLGTFANTVATYARSGEVGRLQHRRGPQLERAGRRATIARTRVVVVAEFGEFADAVATERGSGDVRLGETHGGASVAIAAIAVVAAFIWTECSIATHEREIGEWRR